MKDQFKKAFYTGMGLASLAVDKVKEVSKDIADELQLSEEEGQKFASELEEKVKSEKERLGKLIDEKVEKAVDKLKLTSKEELENLRKRIEELEKKLSDN
ncbi:MAG: phasin family protein [Bacteroidales bacterium]|nr:phasin family protein [Bacteroidales bacterium]